MFKRVTWFTVGAVAGVAATAWAEIRVRRTAARYTPGQVASRAIDGARERTADIADAWHEGRLAMRERERQLRAELEGRPLVVAPRELEPPARRRARKPRR